MSFTTPLALLLLLFIPYFLWVGWPGARLRRRWREWTSNGLRLLIVLLVVLAASGTQIVRAADELAVVFLVDASDSMSDAQVTAAETFVRESVEGMAANDQAAVVVFGANALVERPMTRLPELAAIHSAPQTLQSDLAEAIRLGLALFPAGSARRMVLVSDGIATTGDTQDAARLAASAGVPIDIVHLSRIEAPTEALLTAVSAPAQIIQGESFRINVTAESTRNMPATIRILSGGSIVYEAAENLSVGLNNFSILLRGAEQEFARYTVQLEPAEDTYYQNNQLAAFTEIVGSPRILLVAVPDGMDADGDLIVDESPQLRLALEAAGLEVDRTVPEELPVSLGQLSNYASIILVNVNGKDLTPRQLSALQLFVRDLGGGLVAVGGPESYGMGGYFQTPLEETLPVSMQIDDEERFPSVSIAIVIDRSGSMGAQEGGVTKIQLAAEGAVRVVELLNDTDQIAVIPVDTQPDNPIGPASATEREAIIDLVRQIGAGGGGIYVRAGLEAAADALAQSDNQVKHIIVLADGADSEQKEGVPELIDALVAENTTISFVAIGNGDDVPWLQQMAERGNGRFHFTDRASNLPQIFTQETTSIQRTYLIEERFFPSLASSSPILQGISAVPPLYGYVGTSAKAAAQVILETHQEDPLLASWQYGLGRSVAWTSDATGRWAADWVRWEGFPAFWAQTVRWTISQGRDNAIESVVTYESDSARLTVDARDGEGTLLNNLVMSANIVSPEGETEAVPLAQIAPGRYEGEFTPQSDGAYFIRLAGINEAEDAVVGQTSGWVLGYSPEYQQIESNPALLTEVMEISEGRELTIADIAPVVFSHDLDSHPTVRPIWPWLLLLAALLLPLDVAVRRLVINQSDIARAWAATFGRLRPAAAPAQPRTEPMSRLFQAKERAINPPPAQTGQSPNLPAADAEPVSKPVTAPGGDSARRQPASPPSLPPTQPSSSTLASRLLEKRRQSDDNGTDTTG